MAGEAAETAQDIFSLSDEDFAALSEPTLTEVSDEESTLTDTAEVEETDVAEDVQEESEEEQKKHLKQLKILSKTSKIMASQIRARLMNPKLIISKSTKNF